MKNLSETSLVILAAGRGSRFGGAKQFHAFGQLNKTLMSYNICHAIDKGCQHIVFITQAKHKEELIEKVINHLPKKVRYNIVFQENDDLPSECKIPRTRKKPLGTAHALWCARQVIPGNFCVINADDYYGKQAFELVTTINHESSAMVAYQLKKTLSDFGGVNRGICQLSNDNELFALTECENIHQDGSAIYGETLLNPKLSLTDNTLVSMNFWYFDQQIFPILRQLLLNTFAAKQCDQAQSDEKECYLPDVIALLTTESAKPTKVLTSQDEWFGVTYAADSENVNNKLSELTNKGWFKSLTENKN
ncbi:sugar phosphate nucleotidyltransferase [Colwellia sp. 1_MG-2023]|uniref:sugar phosphate nucleotidyltransferase n=1 Tax=Colwellia sp. 1_MG-2023 TaxID=3062649 RepID=UPI0026E454CD|nr:sugar phosphate nucleotidyltransferase [Colwellia sp. 1_MG-2023]MDO6444690.1 sugar phosphate nucleotidyltransferase [Colwellia sp. 1_MG-2023]